MLTASPDVYLQKVDLARDAALLVQLSESAYRAASFLDDRILAPDVKGRWVSLRSVLEAARSDWRAQAAAFHLPHRPRRLHAPQPTARRKRLRPVPARAAAAAHARRRTRRAGVAGIPAEPARLRCPGAGAAESVESRLPGHAQRRSQSHQQRLPDRCAVAGTARRRARRLSEPGRGAVSRDPARRPELRHRSARARAGAHPSAAGAHRRRRCRSCMHCRWASWPR